MSLSSGFHIVAIPVDNTFFGDVVDAAMLGFEHFRCVSLKARVRPPLVTEQQNTNRTIECAIAYSGIEVASASMGGFNAMACCDRFAMGTGTTNSCSIRVPRSVLVGNEPTNWFHTKAATGEPASYAAQGYVYLGYWLDFTLDSGGRIWVEVSGEIEMCTPFDPADSFGRSADKEVVNAYERKKAPMVEESDGKSDDDTADARWSRVEHPPGTGDRRPSLSPAVPLPAAGSKGSIVSQRR